MAWLAVTRQVATTTARESYPVIRAPKLSLTSSIKQCTTKPNPTTAVQSSMLPWQPLLVLLGLKPQIHFLLQPSLEKLLLQKTHGNAVSLQSFQRFAHDTQSCCTRCPIFIHAFAPFKQNWKRNAVLFILTKVNSEIVLSDALRNFHTRRDEMEMGKHLADANARQRVKSPRGWSLRYIVAPPDRWQRRGPLTIHSSVFSTFGLKHASTQRSNDYPKWPGGTALRPDAMSHCGC